MQGVVGEEKTHWTSELSLLTALLGVTMRPHNLWLVPVMCVRHGTGAFLSAYTATVCVCGVPLGIAELLLGQLAQGGAAVALERWCGLEWASPGYLSLLVAFQYIPLNAVFTAAAIQLLFGVLPNGLDMDTWAPPASEPASLPGGFYGMADLEHLWFGYILVELFLFGLSFAFLWYGSRVFYSVAYWASSRLFRTSPPAAL